MSLLLAPQTGDVLCNIQLLMCAPYACDCVSCMTRFDLGAQAIRVSHVLCRHPQPSCAAHLEPHCLNELHDIILLTLCLPAAAA